MLGRSNAGGGGSGGAIKPENAILVVTVPTGSTVTAVKGSISQTPTMWVSGTYPDQDIALFVFTPAQFDSVNPWTITATDGVLTASDTVLITSNKEYEITLYFYLYLFNNGIMETTVSGGMQATKISGNNGTYSLETVDTNLVAKAQYTSGGNGLSIWYGTVNTIDLSNYSTLKIKISSAIYPVFQNWYGKIGVNTTMPTGSIQNWSFLASTQFDAVNTETTFTVDISAINQLCYVGLGGFSGSAGRIEIVMPQIWLEP